MCHVSCCPARYLCVLFACFYCTFYEQIKYMDASRMDNDNGNDDEDDDDDDQKKKKKKNAYLVPQKNLVLKTAEFAGLSAYRRL